MEERMVDLHTHILPSVDDGPDSVEEAVKLLLAEKRQGVTDVVFTPHFLLADMSVEDFINRRNASFALLRERIKEIDALKALSLHLGAEVRYDPNLIGMDLRPLCIEGTDYLLLEPLGSYPFNFEQTLQAMLSSGIIPILAHTERFSYLVDDKKLLQQLCGDGVVIQCNASAPFSKYYSKNFKKLIRGGFVDVIASDVHNLDKRPPMMREALDKFKRLRAHLCENAVRIIENRFI
jgi:protein-tyrosine phosphatase